MRTVDFHIGAFLWCPIPEHSQVTVGEQVGAVTLDGQCLQCVLVSVDKVVIMSRQCQISEQEDWEAMTEALIELDGWGVPIG